MRVEPFGADEELKATLSLSFNPQRPPDMSSYQIKPCNEEVLEFDNFNFKLAILQMLIYDLELITPYFDIYEFAEQYNQEKIDTESQVPIKPVVNHFKNLPIPKNHAQSMTEIYMDGGNEIYPNIAPMWDGEDNIFDINEVSQKELMQFQNLKKAILISSQFEKVSSIFTGVGITVELL